MSKQRITTTTTKTVEIQHGQIRTEAAVREGRCTGGSLSIHTKSSFRASSLFFADLQELKDIVLAAQELLKAVAERIGQETNDA